MDPIIGGALIGGGANFLGTLFGDHSAKRQMDFQERMSSTSYQRGVKDMQKAGLNPMLAYSQGGASTPMGSMPQIQNPVEGAVSGAKAVMEAQQNKANVELTKAQAAELKSRTFDQSLNTAIRWNELFKLQEDTNKSFWDARQGEENSMLTDITKQLRKLDLQRDQSTFSADVAARKYRSAIEGYGVNAAKAESDFAGNMGEMKPLLMFLKMILGRR